MPSQICMDCHCDVFEYMAFNNILPHMADFIIILWDKSYEDLNFVLRLYINHYSLNRYCDSRKLQMSSKRANMLINKLFTVFLVKNSIEFEKWTDVMSRGT